MSEQSHFQNALSSFTHEVASGGAIRHLTDLGFTAKQIAERLQYPTPFVKVQKEMWQRLIETYVILLEEPGSGKKEKVSYVREYDKYGKSSFRRVVETVGEESGPIFWRELVMGTGLSSKSEGKDCIWNMIQKKLAENGEDYSYVSCDFGVIAYRKPKNYEMLLQLLESRQREYVEGLPWKAQRVYHRMDVRMAEILKQMLELGEYNFVCYFMKTLDKLTIESFSD